MSWRQTHNHWAHLPTERLGGVGHGRSAGRIPMQGALFASSSEFLEGAVSDGIGHKFRGHEGGVPQR